MSSLLTKNMEYTLESRKMIKLLQTCYEVNRFASYEEMNAIVGNIAEKRWLLTNAFKVLKRDYGYLFKVEPRKGYHPIVDDADKVKKISDNRTKRIKDCTSAWREEWQTIDISRLNGDDMQLYISGTIKLSAQEMIQSNKFNDKAAIAAANCSSTKINYSMEAVKALMDVS